LFSNQGATSWEIGRPSGGNTRSAFFLGIISGRPVKVTSLGGAQKQIPIIKRYALVNVGQLDVFDAGSDVSPKILHGRGLVRKRSEAIKILGEGTLSKALTVRAHGFSSKAKEKIEGVGGRAESLSHD